MLKMCSECYSIFSINKFGNTSDSLTYCPMTDCDGELFETEEGIAEIIQILNRKGYYTGFSCSGHIDKTYVDTYIAFESTLPEKALSSLPESFSVEVATAFDKNRFQFKDGERHVVRGDSPSKEDNNVLSRMYYKHRNLEALYIWAMNLDDLNKGGEE